MIAVSGLYALTVYFLLKIIGKTMKRSKSNKELIPEVVEIFFAATSFSTLIGHLYHLFLSWADLG